MLLRSLGVTYDTCSTARVKRRQTTACDECGQLQGKFELPFEQQLLIAHNGVQQAETLMHAMV